jgi:ATP-dependent DNA helicase RecG
MSPNPTAPAQNSSAALYQRTRAAPGECLQVLLAPLRFVKGVGPKRALQLERLGLKTVEDLLYHLPFRYEDRREVTRIGQALPGTEQTFVGRLVKLEKKYLPSRRRYLLRGVLTDGSGAIELVWFRPTVYILKQLVPNASLLVHGKVEWGIGQQRKITHPEFEPVEEGEEADRSGIVPIYLLTEGLPARGLRRWVAQVLSDYSSYLPSFIPENVATRQRLMDLQRAISEVHRPDKSADIPALNRFFSRAHRSIIFDEFFYLQLGLGLKKKTRAAQKGIVFEGATETLTPKMRALLPFRLTQAQERVLREVYFSMESAYPMQRLIQGDVGSGKTIVAWLATVRAIENGFQAVWLAPTELLAEQHFANLNPYADALGISSALLKGSLPAARKRETVERIARAEAQFVVGTHALIQEGIHVPRMGIGVIDEQHRFGVVQRMAFRGLANWAVASAPDLPQPDILLMSATPIPRSLALVLYGDLEVSSLEESPPGRLPIQTSVFNERDRAEVYRRVCAEIRQGRQAYVVCPLVESSERLRLRDATLMFENLSTGIFQDFRLGLLHGRVNSAEREATMLRFKGGTIQVLVATTVIEVGIDVPNATLMVVEHADRFGLSQLHQLRGRVGRGSRQSTCFLLCSRAAGADALGRLRIMEKERNGFNIAQADLRLRGPGELLGTRQSGLADFRLANLIRDSQLLIGARKEALEWLSVDPSLKTPESRSLATILRHRWGERLELGNIG